MLASLLPSGLYLFSTQGPNVFPAAGFPAKNIGSICTPLTRTVNATVDSSDPAGPRVASFLTATPSLNRYFFFSDTLSSTFSAAAVIARSTKISR